MKKFLVNARDIEKSAYIWNAIACTSNSVQSFIFLMIISRYEQITDASIFIIAYTLGTLLSCIGKYGVRNYQISDFEQEFSYLDYRNVRIITIILMMLSGGVYIGVSALSGNCNWYKGACILCFLAIKAVEVYEDVFHGQLQREKRLDVAAKILSIRMFFLIIVFGAMYVLTKNLLITELISLISTIVVSVGMNYSVKDVVSKSVIHIRKNKYEILKKCFPLALTTVIMGYIANMPKFAVDTLANDYEQTCFGVIFMPVFVIGLLGNYLFNPLVGKLSDYWKNCEYQLFIKKIQQIIMLVALIVVFGVAFGEVAGIIILEKIYLLDLRVYNVELAVLILSGGILALINFNIIIATIMRKQKELQNEILVGGIVAFCGGQIVLERFAVLGLAVFYFLVLLCIWVANCVLIYREMNRCEKSDIFCK